MPDLKVHKDYTVTPVSSSFMKSQNPLAVNPPDEGCTLTFNNAPDGTSNGQTVFSYSDSTGGDITFATGSYIFSATAYVPPPPGAYTAGHTHCGPTGSVGNTIQVSDSTS
jgi:hypothetical protein